MANINKQVPAMHDPEPPLEILQQREVFREQGGAEFRVEEVLTKVKGSGVPVTFHVASVKDARPGTVCVALREDGSSSSDNRLGRRYLLARHWRVSTGSWGWEFPRGMGEAGESPVQTAIREFREETGIAVHDSQVTIMQHMHADTGVLRDDIAVTRIVLRGTESIAEDSDWELSGMTWFTEQQMRNLIISGELTDGITLAAFAIVEFAG